MASRLQPATRTVCKRLVKRCPRRRGRRSQVAQTGLAGTKRFNHEWTRVHTNREGTALAATRPRAFTQQCLEIRWPTFHPSRLPAGFVSFGLHSSFPAAWFGISTLDREGAELSRGETQGVGVGPCTPWPAATATLPRRNTALGTASASAQPCRMRGPANFTLRSKAR